MILLPRLNLLIELSGESSHRNADAYELCLLVCTCVSFADLSSERFGEIAVACWSDGTINIYFSRRIP